jgi:hypothetical protein
MKAILWAIVIIAGAMATWVIAPIFGAVFGVGLAIWVLAEMINADDEETNDQH